MRLGLLLCATVVSCLLGGCELLAPSCGIGCPSTHSASSSLVDFLYPKGMKPPPENSIPELHVPLRVGLAFLPTRPGAPGPSAALREQLLEKVRQHFSDRAFVSEIVLIPDYYLESTQGFAGLQGVQRLYAVDVMALVSYDQLSHDDKNEWSFGYWSIVGAYVLKGDRYDISTLIDLAVVDPATQSLVLRAGGVDTRHGNATLLSVQREARDASAASFEAAAGEMITHLDGALTDFQAAVRAGHANVRVVHKDGSKGGAGAFSVAWLLSLLPVIAWRLWRRRAAPNAHRHGSGRRKVARPSGVVSRCGEYQRPSNPLSMRSGLRAAKQAKSSASRPAMRSAISERKASVIVRLKACGWSARPAMTRSASA
jgi:rhombotail lipoprotein